MRKRGDYQLPLDGLPDLAGYSRAEVIKAQVHTIRVLESLSATPKTILSVFGVAQVVEACSRRTEGLSAQQLAFDFTSSCAPHQVALYPSRTRIASQQLDLDLQILSPAGA